MTRLASLLSMVLCLSCTSDDGGDTGAADTGDSDGSTGQDGPIDEASELARAAAYATDFTQINATPFTSQHGLANTVNVWVSPEAVAIYQAIDPADRVLPSFPEGSMIVKEHLDADGAYDGHLIMLKGPEGYAPAASDWWWARVDGSGTTQETGEVGFCVACHDQVKDFDHVFGVPLDNRQ